MIRQHGEPRVAGGNLRHGAIVGHARHRTAPRQNCRRAAAEFSIAESAGASLIRGRSVSIFTPALRGRFVMVSSRGTGKN
jgi:hypothetical protein